VSHQRINVLALSPIPEEGAGCRFRVSQFIPYLRSVGIGVSVSSFYTPEFFRLVYRPGHHFEKGLAFVRSTLRRLAELFTIRSYDAVLLYREAIPFGPPLIERCIAWLGVPIIYDFDDAIFLANVSKANQAFSFLKRPGRVASIVRHSDRVMVGNEYLASFARRHNRHVSVIPTTVDTTKFRPRDVPSRPTGPPVVGWIGSPTTFPYLEAIAGVLRDVNAQHPFILRVSGAGQRADFPGLTIEDVEWRLADEVTLFNTLDIGVYPLPDDEWSKGKCGFKAIQCMACGVPVIASAVGVNRDIIEDGVNGFLAATPDEWIDKLGRLIVDADLRQRFAIRGRETVDQRYSLRVVAPHVAAVIASAVGRPLPSPPPGATQRHDNSQVA